MPSSAGDLSDHYDADAKGSPDGTKICFVSNFSFYDMPFTWIEKTTSETDDEIIVHSTEGFPPSGQLVIQGEVISYQSIGPKVFEGVTRNVYQTRRYPFLKKGWYVTPFDGQLLSLDERRRASEPGQYLIDLLGGNEVHPLLWQRQTDVYVSVIRLPDPPFLLLTPSGVTVVPGENHRETRGYIITCNGERINK